MACTHPNKQIRIFTDISVERCLCGWMMISNNRDGLVETRRREKLAAAGAYARKKEKWKKAEEGEGGSL